MSNVRWYDKNPLIKEIFDFIQKLDAPDQIEIAQEIIQILMTDINIDLDKEINNIDKDCKHDLKRWYDYNPDLHTAFEIIKSLPDLYQKTVMNKIIESALLMYFGHYKENGYEK